MNVCSSISTFILAQKSILRNRWKQSETTLKKIQPSMMTAVPRLLEKLYDKIYAKGADLSGIKKKIVLLGR